MTKLHKDMPIGSHPLADIMPLLNKADRSDIEKSMTEHGFDPNLPIVIIRKGEPISNGETHLAEDAIVDGRNRAICALNAGFAWDDIPKRDYSFAEDGPLVEFIRRHNVDRRHLKEDQRALAAASLAEIITERLKAEKGGDEQEPLNVAGDSSEGVGVDSGGEGERISHKARKEAAKAMGVSEHKTKHAKSIQGYQDLIDAVANESMSLDKAATEAALRKAKERNDKNAERLKTERKDALDKVKKAHGADSPFTKEVIKKKIFGHESKGHGELLTFVELTPAQQKVVVPLLVDGYSLKAALEMIDLDPAETWTITDLVNWAIVQGVGRSKKSKTIDISGMKITIEALAEKARELNLLAGVK